MGIENCYYHFHLQDARISLLAETTNLCVDPANSVIKKEYIYIYINKFCLLFFIFLIMVRNYPNNKLPTPISGFWTWEDTIGLRMLLGTIKLTIFNSQPLNWSFFQVVVVHPSWSYEYVYSFHLTQIIDHLRSTWPNHVSLTV